MPSFQTYGILGHLISILNSINNKHFQRFATQIVTKLGLHNSTTALNKENQCLLCSITRISTSEHLNLRLGYSTEILTNWKQIYSIFFLNWFIYFNKQQIKYKQKVTKERTPPLPPPQKEKNSYSSRSKQSINWEESSRLKANSEVNTSGPFLPFSLPALSFPFFFPWVKGHSRNNTKQKRHVEKIFIFNEVLENQVKRLI